MSTEVEGKKETEGIIVPLVPGAYEASADLSAQDPSMWDIKYVNQDGNPVDQYGNPITAPSVYAHCVQYIAPSISTQSEPKVPGSSDSNQTTNTSESEPSVSDLTVASLRKYSSLFLASIEIVQQSICIKRRTVALVLGALSFICLITGFYLGDLSNGHLTFDDYGDDHSGVTVRCTWNDYQLSNGDSLAITYREGCSVVAEHWYTGEYVSGINQIYWCESRRCVTFTLASAICSTLCTLFALMLTLCKCSKKKLCAPCGFIRLLYVFSGILAMTAVLLWSNDAMCMIGQNGEDMHLGATMICFIVVACLSGFAALLAQ